MVNIVITPQILTDSIFVQYGGATGTSTAAQRQAAYAMAESQAAQEINTFVSPTIVTGTFSWPPMGQPLQLPYTHLRSVGGVTAIHDAGCNCATNSVEISGCAWIMDYDGALIDVRECGNTVKASCAGCSCGSYGNGPFQVRVAATYGLPTGAAFDPRLLMALAMAADLNLSQMINPSQTVGHPGIKSFRSLSYSETRADSSIKATAFGSSTEANYIADLLENFKYHRAGKLGW